MRRLALGLWLPVAVSLSPGVGLGCLAGGRHAGGRALPMTMALDGSGGAEAARLVGILREGTVVRQLRTAGTSLRKLLGDEAMELEHFEAMAAACMYCADWRRAQAILRDMQRLSIEVSDPCLDAALVACGAAGDPASGLAVLQQHRRRGNSISPLAMLGLLAACSRCRDGPALNQVLELALEADLLTDPLIAAAAAATVAAIPGAHATVPKSPSSDLPPSCLSDDSVVLASTGSSSITSTEALVVSWKQAYLSLAELRRKPGVVDLHGSCEKSATIALASLLEDMRRAESPSKEHYTPLHVPTKPLTIITGHGKHSQNGTSSVRRAILKRLDQSDIPCLHSNGQLGNGARMDASSKVQHGTWNPGRVTIPPHGFEAWLTRTRKKAITTTERGGGAKG
mmetsp:Transcript_16924/g.49302  ORF Transcript_16924/g.49302 Transcript_16924/m.49302 type:complete len:398 (-) Transcript_16924:133-1326(-)